VSSIIIINRSLNVEQLGVIDYLDAWQIQKDIQKEVISGKSPNTLLLLEHPSVYTAGRRTQPSDRPVNGTPVIDVDRGGKITWHGIGQIVGYPIIRLKNGTDVVGFVRELENSLIEICKEFGVVAQRYCERSGVWIRDKNGDRKIAAIGLRVAQGVTMHGFALNVNPDLSAFAQIVPCGIADANVTSLSVELNRPIHVAEVMPIVQKHISPMLERVSK
jgi:lipoyl(octanoyl) transferase